MNEEQWRSEYASLDSPETPQPITSVPVAPKPKKHIVSFWAWIVLAIFILGSAALVIAWLNQTVKRTTSKNNNSGVKVQNVDTTALTGSPSSISLDSTDKVVINGELQTNQGVVITPTSQPAVAVLGQLYVDQTTKQIRYYNGQTFVTVATLDSNLCSKNAADCGFALQSDVNNILNQAGSGGGVSSLQGQTGSITLQGTGGLSVSGAGGSINLSLPQTLTTTASPQFAGLTVTGTVNTSSITSSGQITFFANGQSYILPTTGGAGQTICTTGITCTAGGGQAVILGPNTAGVPTVQTNASPTIPSIFINNTGGANLLQLQNGGSDSFVVAQNGSTTITGGNFSQNGTGTFGTGTGAVSLNGATTVASNISLTANGNAVFKNATASSTAFVIQDPTGTANLLAADTSNMRINVGSGGTATAQLYISGIIPTLALGSVATNTVPWSVVVQGRYAYVINFSSNTLQIFDVSNPAAPASVGSVATGTAPVSVQVQGRYAYVVNQTSNTLQIFDVSNVASPASVGTVATGTTPSFVFVQGRNAYVTNQTSNTLQVFDIGNPAAPASTGSVATGTGPRQVYVQGRYAYVVNQTSNTLQIFDVSNPAAPASVGSVATGTTPISLYVQGRYAYVGNSVSNTLQIFDVSNPAAPASVGSVATGTLPRYVIVQDRYAYVINFTSNTLQTIDVSNPAAPSSVGTVATGTAPRGLYVAGRYAYVANSSVNTMQIFDIGGAYTQSLEAGSADVATLQVSNSLNVNGETSLRGGLTVTRGIQVTGDSSIRGKLLVQSTTNNSTAFQILNSSGASLVTVDTLGTTNLVTNGAFNTGIGSWSALGAPTPLPTLAHDPNTDVKLDPTSGSMYITNASTANKQAPAYPIALSANTKYTVTASAKRESTTSTAKIYIGYYTGSDLTTAVEQTVGVPSSTCGNATVILSTSWKTISCTFTTGGSGGAGIYIRDSRTTDVWFLDSVVLQTGNYSPIVNGTVSLGASTSITADSEAALRLQNTTSVYPILNVDSTTGTTVLRPATTDQNVLQVRNAEDAMVINIIDGMAGNISNWQSASNNLAQNRPDFQAAKYTTPTGDTYGYVIGGTNGTNNPQNTVYFAKLSGGNEVWQTGISTGLSPRYHHSVVVAKGYIYVLGGETTGQVPMNDVYYNKIGSNGNMEWPSWQVQASPMTNTGRTPSFDDSYRVDSKALYYGGYIYMLAGSPNFQSGTYYKTSIRALVNADGTLGAWTDNGAGSDLTQGRRDFGATIVGNLIYVVGGRITGSVPTNTIEYATITGPAGALGSFATNGVSLNKNIEALTAEYSGGYLYVIGGKDDSPANLSTVYFAQADGSGSIAEWSSTTMTDNNGTIQVRQSQGSLIHNGVIYVIGGNGSASNPPKTILYASISGNSSEFSLSGSMNVTGAANFGDKVTVANSVDSTAALQVKNSAGGQLFNVDTANANITLNGLITDSGELSPWVATSQLNTARAGHGVAVVNGYIYAVSGSSSNQVEYAKIKTDGTVDTWVNNAVNLPDYKNFAATTTYNGYIYVIGGYDAASGASPTNKIYYGRPNIDGSVSLWRTATTNLNLAVGSPAVAIYGGYLYVMGGGTSSSGGVPSSANTDVQVAKIKPDGSLASFDNTTPPNLPAARVGGRAVVANGRVYYTGGADGAGNAQSTVYYATLGASGALGAWTTNAVSPVAKAYHSSLLINGYIYMFGGTSTTYGVRTDTINYGHIDKDGSIPQWFSTTNALLDTASSHESALANGYIYVVGGYTPVKTVMYSSSARVSVGGSLDLVGLGSRTLSDAGGGGQLTAGNTTVIGTLDVRDAATFTQSVSVGGSLVSHGDVLFQSDANSATVLQIQNASGINILTVDSTVDSNNLVTNPNFEADTTGWTALGSSTLSRTTTASQVYEGVGALQVATTAAANDGAKYNYALAASTTYSFSFRVRITSGTMTTFNLGYSPDGATQTSCTLFGGDLTVYNNGWRYVGCNFTTGAVSGTRFVYLKQSDATARNIYIDAVKLEQASATTAYRNSAISLNSVINTDLSVQSVNNSDTALAVYNASGILVFNVDTANQKTSATSTVGDALKGVTSVTGRYGVVGSGFGIGGGVQGVGYDGYGVFGNSSSNASGFFQTSNTGGTNTVATFIVKANTSQTADLLQAQDSTGTVLASITSGGTIVSSGAPGTGFVTKLNADTNNRIEIIGNLSGRPTIQFGSGSAATDTNLYRNTARELKTDNNFTVQTAVNSTAALSIQNAAGNTLFAADTTNGQIMLGTANVLSGKLAFNSSTSANTVTLQPGALTGLRTLTLPDETGTLCTTAGSAACTAVYAAASGSGNYIQNQSAVDQTANFRISGTGRANIALQAPLFDTATATALAIGTTNATGINLNQSTTIASGKNLTFAGATGNFDQSASSGTFATGTGAVSLNGATTVASNKTFTANGSAAFAAATNSATAFVIQNAASADTLFSADTTARSVSGGNLIKIGNSTGTDGNTTILQVDSATADPTSNLAALNGGIFYNSTSNKLKIIESGVVKTLCNLTDAGCGTGVSTTLQGAYNNGSAGDQVIALNATNDSVIIRNPSSGGTASSYALTVDQLATGATGGLDIQSAGTTSRGLNIDANNLTTGTELRVSTTSNALTTGSLAVINQTSTYTSLNPAVSGNSLNVARNVTYNNAASNGINLDSSSSAATVGSVSSLTWSHTTNGTANRILIVSVATGNAASNNVSSITYNGVNLTKLSTVNAVGAEADIWYLVNPPAGTYNVIITVGSISRIIGGAATWSGVHQTTSFGTAVTATGVASPTTVNVSSAAGEVVIDSMARNDTSALTVGAGQTQIHNLAADAIDEGASSYAAGAASVTMSWTHSGGFVWATIGVPLKPANGGVPQLALQGDVAALSSTCVETNGNCADSSHVLSLNQQYAKATGSALQVQNAGTGDSIRTLSGSGQVTFSVGPQSSSNARAQVNVYNTLEATPTNYERLAQYADSTNNVFRIETQQGGTGVLRNIVLQPTDGTRLGVGNIASLAPTAKLHIFNGAAEANPALKVNQNNGSNNVAQFEVSGAIVFSVSGGGNTQVKKTSTTAFEVQDATGTALLTADTSAMKVTVKDLVVNGTLTVNGHIISGNTSGSTTVAANANCGTGCTASISGNDTAGVITVNTGTTAAAGIQAIVTFAATYGTAPVVVLTPKAVPASSTFPQYYYSATGTTFDLLTYTALTDSKTYTFGYHIIK